MTLPVTRVDWVVEGLRRAILTGELAPGRRLLTSELTQMFKVSQTPLREALQRLAAEGLVEILPQRGARVSTIDVGEGMDIYRVRLLLEPAALRSALESEPDPEWDRRIGATLEELSAASRAEPFDPVVFEQRHTEFHQLLLEPCGSLWLLRITGQLTRHSARIRLMSVYPRGGMLQLTEEHRQLAKLCHARQPSDAEDELRKHLEATVDLVLADSGDVNP